MSATVLAPPSGGEHNSSAERRRTSAAQRRDLDGRAGRDVPRDRVRGARSAAACSNWVSEAHLGWLIVAVALEIGSCLGYVAVVRLVLHKGPAREVRRLAWAEQAFGAVVPLGGAGGLAVGAWAMRAWGVPWSRVANRSAVIFLLTSAVNAAVLALAGLGVWAGIGTDHAGLLYGLVPATATIVALGAFWSTRFLTKYVGPEPGAVGSLVQRIASWVRDTEQVAFHGGWRVFGSISYLDLRHRGAVGVPCARSA